MIRLTGVEFSEAFEARAQELGKAWNSKLLLPTLMVLYMDASKDAQDAISLLLEDL